MPNKVCFECGSKPKYSWWHEVQGFEQARPGGGTNHIALRKRTGRILCEGCMAKRKSGIHGVQHIQGQMSVEEVIADVEATNGEVDLRQWLHNHLPPHTYRAFIRRVDALPSEEERDKLIARAVEERKTSEAASRI